MATNAERRTALLKVRATPEFKARLEAHARSRGLEFSAWARLALRLQADREASYLPITRPHLDPLDVAAVSRPLPKPSASETPAEE